jgi:hypothetical protein
VPKTAQPAKRAARRARRNSPEVQFMGETTGTPRLAQTDVLTWLGRASCGYSSTEPDGECAVVAPEQTRLMSDAVADGVLMSVEAARERAERSCDLLRRHIRDQFFASTYDGTVLRSFLTDERCTAALNHPANAHVDRTSLPGRGNNWRAFAELYARQRRRGGIWLDEPALRAYAVHLGRDIVVVSRSGAIVVYPRHLLVYHLVGTDRTYDLSEPSIVCVDTEHRDYIPGLAFDPTTIVICYNGKDHFWCSELTAAGRAQNSAAHWAALRAACPVPVHDLRVLQ